MSTSDEESRGVLRSVLPPEQVDRFLSTCDAYGWQLLAVSTLAAAALPLLGLEAGYRMTVFTEMFLFAILALSWDLVGGQTGYPSFGNMAFFGIGAYATAILTKDFALSFPVAFLLAGLLAVTFAAVIGVIVLRLRGHYFAIATLGVLLAAQQISRNLDITGGASGKILLQTPSGETFYYLFLGVLVVEMALVYYLSGTRFGFVLNAIRDDEEKATAMGFNTTYYKTAAWMLAGLFTGFAGAAYSLFNTFIDPQTAYNGAWNVELIAMALLGGPALSPAPSSARSASTPSSNSWRRTRSGCSSFCSVGLSSSRSLASPMVSSERSANTRARWTTTNTAAWPPQTLTTARR
ncbi:branched-chain amino acid ABC transporter permease [Haloarcula sp. NS06]|uniref:branched-chain amino acid ABC transporter permease n=1 Tax=Haloarcula sp. NS06 TaxID=3409688 RepID=UPI003DA742CA